MKKVGFIVLLMFCSLLCSCKEWGTEGGNPTLDSGIDYNVVENFVTGLTATICEKRDNCLSLTDTNCPQDLITHPSVTTELGLNPPYQHLQALLVDKQPQIRIDVEKFRSCLKQVQAFSCQELIGNDVVNPNNKNNIHEILRVSDDCADSVN